MSKDALEQFKLKALVDYFYFVLPKSKKKNRRRDFFFNRILSIFKAYLKVKRNFLIITHIDYLF